METCIASIPGYLEGFTGKQPNPRSVADFNAWPQAGSAVPVRPLPDGNGRDKT